MRLTNFSMETGTGSTDSSGQAQLSLKGQYFYAPVVTVIGQADTSGAAVDAFGNTNVYIMLNTSHKFISTYGHNDLKPFMNISVALVLSEIICRKSGFSEAAMVREKFNELLNTGFLGE